MRRLLLSAPLLLVASCGAPDRADNAPQDLKSYDVEESSADMAVTPAAPPPVAPQQRAAAGSAGPDVSPTAAPGVAFNYRYAFRLPAQRVAQVQEQHARICEQLGPNRCRITGMRYRVVNERDIEAMLAFKLEPMLARRFGQSGVELVTRSQGMLVDAEISGVDVGSSIRAAGRSIAEMSEELRRLEARLAGRLSSDERARLEYEAQQLRQSIRAYRQTREEQQESLATTPMVFQYGSGDLVPGFGEEMSLGRAWREALDNLRAVGLGLLIITVTLAPWVLLGWLIWWGIVRLRRRWFAKPTPAAAENNPAT